MSVCQNVFGHKRDSNKLETDESGLGRQKLYVSIKANTCEALTATMRVAKEKRRGAS